MSRSGNKSRNLEKSRLIVTRKLSSEANTSIVILSYYGEQLQRLSSRNNQEVPRREAKGMDVQVKLSCDVAFGILSLRVD